MNEFSKKSWKLTTEKLIPTLTYFDTRPYKNTTDFETFVIWKHKGLSFYINPMSNSINKFDFEEIRYEFDSQKMYLNQIFNRNLINNNFLIDQLHTKYYFENPKQNKMDNMIFDLIVTEHIDLLDKNSKTYAVDLLTSLLKIDITSTYDVHKKYKNRYQ